MCLTLRRSLTTEHRPVAGSSGGAVVWRVRSFRCAWNARHSAPVQHHERRQLSPAMTMVPAHAMRSTPSVVRRRTLSGLVCPHSRKKCGQLADIKSLTNQRCRTVRTVRTAKTHQLSLCVRSAVGSGVVARQKIPRYFPAIPDAGRNEPAQTLVCWPGFGSERLGIDALRPLKLAGPSDGFVARGETIPALGCWATALKGLSEEGCDPCECSWLRVTVANLSFSDPNFIRALPTTTKD